MALIVKVCYAGDVRRKRFSPMADVSIEDIDAFVRDSFGLAAYVARYLDEEGDACTLTALTLQDALDTVAFSGAVLRLDIKPMPALSNEAATHESTTSPVAAATAALPTAQSVGPEDAWILVSEDGQEDEELTSPKLPEQVPTFAIHTPMASTPQAASTPRTLVTMPPEGAETPGIFSVASTADLGVLAPTPAPQDVDGSVNAPAAEMGSDPAATELGALRKEGDQQTASEGNPAVVEEPGTPMTEGEEPACSGMPGLGGGLVTLAARELTPSAHATPPASPGPGPELPESVPELPPSAVTPEAAPMAEQEAAESQQAAWTPPAADEALTRPSADDKVSIVLAAFDGNGDGSLNFEECNALQEAAWGGQLDTELYHALCEELGVDPHTGLGFSALEAMYARYGTLDRDFAASLAKLQQGLPEGGLGCSAADAAGCRAKAGSPLCRLAPLLALPLALGAPVIGIPMAVLAARRHWRP